MSFPGMGKECFQSLTKETALGNQLLSLFPHFPGRQNTGIISSQTFQLRYAEQAPAKQASLSTKGSLLTVRWQWVSCIFNHFICLPGWRTYNRNPSRKTSECLEKWDVTSQETTKERQNVQTTTWGSAQTMSARKNRKHSEAVKPGSMGEVLHMCFFNPRILWWTVMDSFLQMRKLRHNAGTNLSHLFKVTVGSGRQGCNQNTVCIQSGSLPVHNTATWEGLFLQERDNVRGAAGSGKFLPRDYTHCQQGQEPANWRKIKTAQTFIHNSLRWSHWKREFCKSVLRLSTWPTIRNSKILSSAKIESSCKEFQLKTCLLVSGSKSIKRCFTHCGKGCKFWCNLIRRHFGNVHQPSDQAA